LDDKELIENLRNRTFLKWNPYVEREALARILELLTGPGEAERIDNWLIDWHWSREPEATYHNTVSADTAAEAESVFLASVSEFITLDNYVVCDRVIDLSTGLVEK
jgi:hypothetical protein